MTDRPKLKKDQYNFSRESLLKRVIETAPDGLVIIDNKGIIRSFNPAAERMFRYKASEVFGLNISCLMPSPDAEQHDAYIKHYRDTGKTSIIGLGRNVVARKKNGTLFPVELSVGEVMANGESVFTGFIRDLSEQYQSEKQILELRDKLVHMARHSAMGELASTLSHEMNQPLTAIANYTLVIQQIVKGLPESSQKDQILELLQKAAAQAQRGGETLRSIRSFIKHSENSLMPGDLEDAVNEAVKIASVGTRNRNIQVTVETKGQLPTILMDRIQIQQVVTNLVRNAIDSLEEHEGDKWVYVKLKPHGHRSVIVQVRDSGPGIPEPVRKRLFESFNTSKHDGVGIGLSICKRIIASHNGEIRGRNRKSGGAEFQFVLPIDAKGEEI